MHGSNGFHNAILSNNPDCEPFSCALCYFIMPNTWFRSMLTSDTSGGRPQTTRAHGERFTCSQSRRVHPSKCKVQLSDATWMVKIDRDFYLMQIFAINPWIFFFCELNAVHTWRFMLHLRCPRCNRRLQLTCTVHGSTRWAGSTGTHTISRRTV